METMEAKGAHGAKGAKRTTRAAVAEGASDPPGGGSTDDGRAAVPLTDLAFNILLSLKGAELHGYALLKELRSRTGRQRLRTGTVYAALARLQDEGLVEEAEDRPATESEDDRRRYYRVTKMGDAAARAEAARLSELVGLARAKDLLPEGGSNR